jgi:hypothetical protein
MRNLLLVSAAVSALALVSTHQVAALSPGAPASPHGLVHKAQKSDDTPGARGKDGAQRGVEPGQRSEGGNRSGTAQDKGDRGTNMRSGDKGARTGQHRTNVDVNVGRGRQGHHDRVDRRTRVGVAVDNRHRSRRDVDVGVGVRSYGYTPGGCQEILRRYRQCVAR